MNSTTHQTQSTTHKTTLSVVLATKNEESNIAHSLDSVKKIADEIIIFDEYSTDKTREIARKYGAKVFKHRHETNFHETKQKAIEKASGDWILQLDADEVVTPELADEITEVINSVSEELQRRVLRHSEFFGKLRMNRGEKSQISPRAQDLSRDDKKLNDQKSITNDPKKLKLFRLYQSLIEKRDGDLGKNEGEIVAFFIPRKNIFLGKPLIHAGVYPDAVIRLFKKGKAYLPAKSVHELPKVDGQIGWLFSDLEHHDSPTFRRYLDRANRYTDYTAIEFENKFKSKVSYWHLFHYSTIKPLTVFINLYIRHKGFIDGFPGFVWSLFSALHSPIAYFKYWQKIKS